MEQTKGDIGIKIYSATPPNEELPTTTAAAAADGGRKRHAVVAKGVQKTLSKTSLLANFLPTGTLLTFETLVPTVYHGGGECAHVTTLMVTALLSCARSPASFFFHYTDSFRGPDGPVYYGFVTPNGLAVFKPGNEEMDEVMEGFPLMVGIICSGLFLVFPNTRYGIGCMAT
ncbi:hypothetical protein RHSIM_Rhsim10G0037800 [Rhododendron simsii]|uniref:Uncharacterized protein n=1 Tax=Rhododendron simsii TaxID=118357 RepID=A0A834GA99_RHOSS|nr:hypothetical protein RHSIM_Rhsim10G0037800 [Rhododendron simsii]